MLSFAGIMRPANRRVKIGFRSCFALIFSAFGLGVGLAVRLSSSIIPLEALNSFQANSGQRMAPSMAQPWRLGGTGPSSGCGFNFFSP